MWDGTKLLSEHEQASLQGQSAMPAHYRECSVGGVVFCGWQGNFAYDSSAAWAFWTDTTGARHLGLARILYFVVISACMHVDCKQEVLARVQWFQVDRDKRMATLEPKSKETPSTAFVFARDIDPVKVILVPTLRLASRARLPVVAKRSRGPFRVLTLEHTRWC